MVILAPDSTGTNPNSSESSPEPEVPVHSRSHSGWQAPHLPLDSIYTKNYCEENIYLLAQVLSQTHSEFEYYVVFISNPDRTVALWKQKASREPPPDDIVIWDYHVILLVLNPNPADSEAQSWVYDFDTSLAPVPYPTKEYIQQTFREQELLNYKYRSMLKVIPAQIFLDTFASDRSHMLIPGSNTEHISPIPIYTAIRGSKVQIDEASNLMSKFVDMRAEFGFEYVKSVEEFKIWLDAPNESTVTIAHDGTNVLHSTAL